MLNIAEVAVRSAEKWGDRKFLIFEGKEISFSDFLHNARKWQSYLESQNIGRGDIVACFSRNNPEVVYLWFALSFIGAVFSPYNFNLKPAEVSALAGDSSPKIIFTDTDLPLPSSVNARVAKFHDVVLSSESSNVCETSPDDMCTLLYTSGTEDLPKGVMNTHLNWFSTMMSGIYDLDWTSHDTFLLSIPLYHVAGLYTMLGFLNAGGSVVLQAKPDIKEIELLIRKHGTTYLIFPPTVYVGLSQMVNEPLESVRKCISFGAFLAPKQIEMIQRILPGVGWRNYYGLTEATPLGASLSPEDFDLHPGSIGKPHINVSLRLVKDDGKDASAGETGEIWIRGPSVAKGYYHRIEQTARTFGEGWLRTGDLARRDDDGFLYFVDRKKDIIRTGGENVSSVEVEGETLKISGIAEAAAVGLPHRYWGEAVTVFATARKGENLVPEKIIAELKGRMAGYKVPKKVIVLDSLPHNPSGKILKKELKKEFAGLYGDEE